MDTPIFTRTASRRARWVHIVLLVMALTAVMLAAGAAPAEASHFRYGHISWSPEPAPPNTIDFTIQNAFRRDGYVCRSTVPPHPVVPCTGPPVGLTPRPGPGDVILENIGGTQFFPGDSSVISSSLGALLYVVTAIDPANNWLFGNALDPNSFPAIDPLVTHTYATPGDYLGNIDSVARISANVSPNSHLNNPNGGYRVETLVNVGTQAANASPVSVVPVIVPCPINGQCIFQIPAADANGDPLTFRLSTAPEASSANPSVNENGTACPATFCQPGPPFSTNAASVSPTGVYTWDTAGAQLGAQPNDLYSTQVTIEDRDALGNVKSKVAVDFFIQLVVSVGNRPRFDVPPTPPCGSMFTVNVGQTLTFTVQASDPDMGDVVTLNVVGLPPGATMNPPLPAQGNPVASVFSWTPAIPGGPFVVTFTATDQTLQFETCSFTMTAVPAQPPADEEDEDDADEEDGDHDGKKDDEDDDDDNDGENDTHDADDDNDGIEDDVDADATHESKSSRVFTLGSGQEARFEITTDPATLLVTAVLADGSSVVADILDPVGAVIGGSVPRPGRTILPVPTTVIGDYVIRVRNIGPTDVTSKLSVVRSNRRSPLP